MRAALGTSVITALMLKAPVGALVEITESDGALDAAVAALASWVGWSSGWMDSAGAGGGGASMLPVPGSSKSVCGADCRTSTTLPKTSTKTKCSATLIVKNRDRPNRLMKARTAGCRGARKEKAAMGGNPLVLWQGRKGPARGTSTTGRGTLTPGKF